MKRFIKHKLQDLAIWLLALAAVAALGLLVGMHG